ncbi:NAD(P)/FAD-dependent oxidoreductase [[Limnothrix rosea] IAM M-220]|uniref:NAD(P)/FAD-dependent oxidoreductase n=1 Tax=[Limnothrix rosea] IAM M-220 TaxID=454133 RepID=UPI0015591CED|nr:FAD-dependent oxidoreductase [[Limnothrix rosea] IAM M-220]
MLNVAVVGVGLAGISAAVQCQKQGLNVALFDKSRGVGGRLATRRGFETRFDHGLPSWQIQGDRTQQLTEELIAENLLKPWQIARTNFNNIKDLQALETKISLMAPDGMTAIAKYLARDLTLNRSYHLEKISQKSNHWELAFKNGEVVITEALILAIPCPQALPLVKDFITTEIGDRLKAISYEAALSLMLGFEALELNFPWQELRLDNHPIFKKIILDGQKRSPRTPTLVVQTNATFTKQYLDTNDLEPAAQILITKLQALFNLSQPSWHQIHRWRYALTKATLGDNHLALPTTLPLILCGDWCLGNGIEGAIASGTTAAKHFLEN